MLRITLQRIQCQGGSRALIYDIGKHVAQFMFFFFLPNCIEAGCSKTKSTFYRIKASSIGCFGRIYGGCKSQDASGTYKDSFDMGHGIGRGERRYLWLFFHLDFVFCCVLIREMQKHGKEIWGHGPGVLQLWFSIWSFLCRI